MVPAGLTIAALLADATSVVTEYAGLITLVAGLGFGIFGVKFLIGQIRAARH